MTSELSPFDRKVIIADIRSLKRQLLTRMKSKSALTYTIKREVIVEDLIKKYCKLTSLQLAKGMISPDNANSEILGYKAEIPKIFDKEFEIEQNDDTEQ